MLPVEHNACGRRRSASHGVDQSKATTALDIDLHLASETPREEQDLNQAAPLGACAHGGCVLYD